ncbi:MAG: T9SS type A sorting domain-containing protein [Candidatus Kapaibacterium sp.]
MKNKFLLILFFALSYSQLNSQWIDLNMGNGFSIFDFSFPNAQTGYICGYGGLFKKTTNGGINWIDLSFPTTENSLNAVHFFNANTGLLAADSDTIYRTVNGTNNWSERIFIGFQVQDFHFLDSLIGYASGLNRLAFTTNGGLNWSTSIIQSSGQIFFINQNTGWTLGNITAGSNVLKTTNGGVNWQIQHSTSDFRIIYDIYFLDENTGYTSGYRHNILKTTNGGQNWVSQNDVSSASGLYSIYFINHNTGWTVGDFYSTTNTSNYFTTNGGANWISGTEITGAGRLHRVKINNSPVGYIAGQSQRMYKTTNAGGLTGITNNPNVIPSGYSLSQNYPNPFNPSTKINFALSKQGLVTLRIYDVLGREIRTLVNEVKNAGRYTVDINASEFSSGVYFYRLQANDFTDIKRMMLIK